MTSTLAAEDVSSIANESEWGSLHSPMLNGLNVSNYLNARRPRIVGQRFLGLSEGGIRPGKGRDEIVDPEANTETVFQDQPPDSRSESPKTRNDSPDPLILSH